MISITDNPILVKHIRSRLRKQQVSTAMAAIAIVCMLILFGGFQANGIKNGVAFSIFFWLQGLILVLVGTNQVSSAVASARQSEILDFHRVSPRPASEIAFGFLLGAPIREYVLVAVITPFAAICAMTGKPGLLSYLILLALLVSSSMVFHCIGMVAALSSAKRTGKSGGGTVLAVLAHFFSGQIAGGLALPATLTVIPAFIEALAGGAFARGPRIAPRFFGADLPMWVQSFAYQLPLLGFFFLAVVRRIRSEQAHLYSKPQAAAFLATGCVLVLAGLIKPPILQIADYALVGALISIVLLGLFLIGAVTPDLGTYSSGIRRAQRLGKDRASILEDAASNIFITIGLGLLVLLAGEIALSVLPKGNRALVDNPHFRPLSAALTMMSFGFALQFFLLHFGRKSRSYFGFLIFLWWGVPLLLAAVVSLQARGGEVPGHIASISPLGAITGGKLPGLVVLAIATVIFGVLVREVSYRAERNVVETTIAEAV